MSVKLFQKKGSYVECLLCPHRCKLKKGEFGKCSVRKCDGDTIFLSNYGELVSVAINPIEKKPFYKYLPGTKTLSFGGVGCSLLCKFCEQHRISQVSSHPDLKKFLPKELIEIAKDKHCQSICMTFNEPTISFEYLIDVAEACHKNDLKFILKTNAYVNKEPWREICAVTDAINVDWKGNNKQYFDIMGAKEHVVNDRIKEAYNSGVHLEISIPLYHSFIDIIYPFSQFLGSLDNDIPCHLLKINPAHRFVDNEPINEASYKMAKYIMLLNMKNVFME